MADTEQPPRIQDDPVYIKIQQAINTAKEMENKQVECILTILSGAMLGGKDSIDGFNNYCQIFNMAMLFQLTERSKR